MKQITVLAQAQSGVIAAVTEVLAASDVSIHSIAGEEYGGHAVINVSVDDETAALYALQRHPEWQVLSEDALLVRVEDEVGALAKLARYFTDAGIPLRSIRFVERHDGYALVAVSTTRPEEARAAARNIGKE